MYMSFLHLDEKKKKKETNRIFTATNTDKLYLTSEMN